MKYASTKVIDGVERVVVVLPLSTVPAFDPSNPPQDNTYGVSDDVQVGWEKQPDGWFAPHTPTAAEILVEKKKQRQAIVDAITVYRDFRQGLRRQRRRTIPHEPGDSGRANRQHSLYNVGSRQQRSNSCNPGRTARSPRAFDASDGRGVGRTLTRDKP